MNIIEQAQRYLDKIPSAVSGAGGHDRTYSVAMVLVEGFGLSTTDARGLMIDYSNRCSPPWSEREIDHKLASAEQKIDPSKRGSLVRAGVRYKMGATTAPRPAVAQPAQHHAPKAAPKAKAIRYEIADSLEMPEPVADGTRKFIQAAFQSGEGIRIAVGRRGEDGREQPKDAGVTLSREEWIRKLDAHKGNPNGFMKTSERNGIFISVNPMTTGGRGDKDVTAYRHALLEFDHISTIEQWGIIVASKIPCSAVISSGGKSIHAWVKVEAEDRKTFDERVQVIFKHFEEYKPDPKNKNPSRFSRLPNCERGKSSQELLALNIGCESFADWLRMREVESSGQTRTPADLRNFDVKNDPNKLLGNRWMGRGMSCLFIGPSGVGKSSLTTQFAICWAIGRPALGIVPVGPLKSLIVQAENDDGDLAEMFNGVCSGFEIEPSSEEESLIDKNIVFHTDESKTGQAFLDSLHRLIDLHHPDIVWLDPILSFVGADISRQEVIAEFFRNSLNPILKASGAACFCVHHTGKPPTDKGARQGWQNSDYAYAGLGSSDLTNWARAALTLQDKGDGLFELRLSKRGKRAGVLADDGVSIATSLWMRHSSNPELIFWEQSKAPVAPEKSNDQKEPKKTKPQMIATMNKSSFLYNCPSEGEGLRELMRRLKKWLASGECPKKMASVSDGTIRSAIDLLIENNELTFSTEKELYYKGQNA